MSVEGAYRRTAPQPLSAFDNPDALLTVVTVSALTGFSASTLYRLAKRGELVPMKIGPRFSRYRAGDVGAFLRAQRPAVVSGSPT